MDKDLETMFASIAWTATRAVDPKLAPTAMDGLGAIMGLDDRGPEYHLDEIERVVKLARAHLTTTPEQPKE